MRIQRANTLISVSDNLARAEMFEDKFATTKPNVAEIKLVTTTEVAILNVRGCRFPHEDRLEHRFLTNRKPCQHNMA